MEEVIRQFDRAAHSDGLIEVWQKVFDYLSPHNAPEFVMNKKLATNDGLLFVAESDGKVVGSVMAGYDGHRGWLYSLAVLPDYRGRGIGSRLVKRAEEHLKALGCPKINLQIMNGNENVQCFYRRLGYETEQRISMGKKIPTNIDGVESGS